MKKLLILFMLATSMLVHANQTDTLVTVRLEKNTRAKYGIYMVFENISSDTAFILSRFKLYRNKFPGSGSGFMPTIFLNKKSIYARLEGSEKEYYVFSKRSVLIPPHSKVKLSFDASDFYRQAIREKNEYGISFHIQYYYDFLYLSRKGKVITTETNCVIFKEKEVSENIPIENIPIEDNDTTAIYKENPR